MASTPKYPRSAKERKIAKTRATAQAGMPKPEIRQETTNIYVGEIIFNGFADQPIKKPVETEKPVTISNTKRDEIEKRIIGLTITETQAIPKPDQKIGEPKFAGQEKRKTKKLVGKGKNKTLKEVNETVNLYKQSLAGSIWTITAAPEALSKDGNLLYDFRKGTQNYKRRAEISADFPEADFSEAEKIEPRIINDLITRVLRGKTTDPKVITNEIDGHIKGKLDRLHKELREKREQKARQDAATRAREIAKEREKTLDAFNTPLELQDKEIEITHFDNKYTAAFLNEFFRSEGKDENGNSTGYEINHILFNDVVSATFDELESSLKTALIVDESTIKGLKIRVTMGNDGSYPSAEIQMLTRTLGKLAGAHGAGHVNFYNKFKNKNGEFDRDAFINYVRQEAKPFAHQLRGATLFVHKDQVVSPNSYQERFERIGTFKLQKTIDTLFTDTRSRRLLEAFTDHFGDNVKVTIDDKNPAEKAFVATLPMVNGQSNPRLRDIIASVLMTISSAQIDHYQRTGKSISLNENEIEQIIRSVEENYDSDSPTVHPKIIGLDFKTASNADAAKESLAKEVVLRELTGQAQPLPEGFKSKRIKLVDGKDADGKAIVTEHTLSLPPINKDGTLHLREHPDPDKQVMIPTEGHRKFLNLSALGDMVLIDGPAGSGKTFWMCYRAAEMFARQNNIQQIIVSAPAVDVGSSIGFLPGTDYEKMYPYVQQILQKFDEIFGHGNKAKGKKFREALVEQGQLVVMPSNVLRGYDADGVVGVFDEAQNWSWIELKTIATRLGKGGSKFFFGGHDGQCDKPTRKDEWAIFRERLNTQKFRDKGLYVTEMEAQDVMRHKLVRALQEDGCLDDPYGDSRDKEGKANPVVALAALAKNMGVTLDELVAGMTNAYEKKQATAAQENTGQAKQSTARISSGPVTPKGGPGG